MAILMGETMSNQISTQIFERLKALDMLASFSPEAFYIFLNIPTVKSIKDLSQEDSLSLIHEFSHLMYYCTSYIGLKHLYYWAKAIAILEDSPSGISPEEVVTIQSALIIENERSRQILCIDDEYYYEVNRHLSPVASKNTSTGTWKGITGALFHVDGKISDRRFWGLRFFLGAAKDDYSNSFARIPVGIRTILEHTARATDFGQEWILSENHVHVLKHFIDEAFSPEMLHYCALTHYVAAEMERKFNTQAQGWSFFVTGQLVALLSEIPFDNHEVWKSIQKFAELAMPEYTQFMTHPHLSFVFPLVVRAAFDADITLEGFIDTNELEINANKILSTIGLKAISEYLKMKYELLDQIRQVLGASLVGNKIISFLDRMKEQAEKVQWMTKLVTPAISIGEHSPVPIIFNDGGFIPGQFFDLEAIDYLSFLAIRRRDMLRYPFVRNIVEYETPAYGQH